MTKKEVRKAAYKAIVKEGRPHQEVFDELRKEKVLGADKLAEEISKIPSDGKLKATSMLRNAFIGSLGVVN